MEIPTISTTQGKVVMNYAKRISLLSVALLYAVTASATEIPDFVLKAKSVISISGLKNAQGLLATGPTNGTQPITIINDPNTFMMLDASLFAVPAIANEILDFGYLQVGAVFDNNTHICGPDRNQKCGTAWIRTYTTGTAGPGLYNSRDGISAPLSAGQEGQPKQVVGLNPEGAVVLQTFPISTSRHTVKLTDFVNPKYNYVADFIDAGAGSYATTIVVEYGLSL